MLSQTIKKETLIIAHNNFISYKQDYLDGVDTYNRFLLLANDWVTDIDYTYERFIEMERRYNDGSITFEEFTYHSNNWVGDTGVEVDIGFTA
ncbi:MAG: hypothetical protein KKD44_29605 [Proteobacteria bacterium]|nr:hypothetical protein [Pseudomonadota bacterium]